MMFIQKIRTLFVLLLVLGGAGLHPTAKTASTTTAYSALSNPTVSESFDVLDTETALKTALYLNAAPQETKKCSALMSAFNQQMKYRPEVVKVLKRFKVDIDEPGFAEGYTKAVISYFVINGIIYLLNNQDTKINIKGREYTFSASIENNVIVKSLFWSLIENIIGKGLFGANPNAYRLANLSMPNRLQSFSHQMIEAVGIGLTSSLMKRTGIDTTLIWALTSVLNVPIMNAYVNWSRTKALAELTELEQELPASLVTEVNELIKK